MTKQQLLETIRRVIKEEVTATDITDITDIVRNTIGLKATVRRFKNNILVASPGRFFPFTSLLNMANELNDRIPEAWLESPVNVGTGGATEGLLIIRLTDEGMKHTNLFEAEEDFTPIEDSKELKTKLTGKELKEKYPVAGEDGNVRVSQLKKGDILGATGLEIVSVSAGAKTPSGKLEVTVKNPKTGKEVTKLWGKSTVVKLKDKTEEAAAPAPSKPKEKPDVAEPPVKSPGKPKPRRPLGNPDVKPAPKAEATMNEADILKQIVKRFKAKK